MRPLNLASRFLPHGPKAQHSQYVSLYLRQWRIARRILPLFHHEPCLCNLSRARTIDFGPQFFLDEYVCNQNYVINHIKNDYLESGSAGARRTERSRRDQGWARASPRAPASECVHALEYGRKQRESCFRWLRLASKLITFDWTGWHLSRFEPSGGILKTLTCPREMRARARRKVNYG